MPDPLKIAEEAKHLALRYANAMHDYGLLGGEDKRYEGAWEAEKAAFDAIDRLAALAAQEAQPAENTEEQLSALVQGLDARCAELEAANTALLSERDALAADAGRLDWLLAIENQDAAHLILYTEAPEDCRAAIDRARAGSGEEDVA